MLWMSVSCGAVLFMTIVILLSPAGQKADVKKRRITQSCDKVRIEKYEELELSFYDRFYKPILMTVVRRLAFFIPKRNERDNKILERSLRYAGLTLSPSEFTAIKTVFLIGVFSLGILIAFVFVSNDLIRLLIIVVGLLVGVMAPIFVLRSKTNQRKVQIMHQLPDVIDVLMVSVEAGLGLDEAILRMSARFQGVIVDEFNYVLKEIQMGKHRKDAFARLTECADVKELKTFVSAVVQAEQLGIPIKNVLSVQSSAMRELRRQTAQEKGMKAPVKMLIPMVLFILPVLIIILMAPVVIQLIEQFS